MNKIRSLSYPQKIILVILALLVVVFSVLYPITISRKGYEYLGSILVQKSSGENTMYSGKVRGRQAEFTVTPDKTVTFRCGEKTYGPYTVTEDPSAIPKENPLVPSAEFEAAGLVVQKAGETIFRGCRVTYGSEYLYFNDDGRPLHGIRIIPADGTVTDEDYFEPSVVNILELAEGPQLTHQGKGYIWFLGVVICAAAALSVIFADELFRWNLRYTIVNTEGAEPTDWVIVSRYISWSILIITALMLFIAGLN